MTKPRKQLFSPSVIRTNSIYVLATTCSLVYSIGVFYHRELDAMSGVWFYEKFRKSKRNKKTNKCVTGTDLVRSSFKKRSHAEMSGKQGLYSVTIDLFFFFFAKVVQVLRTNEFSQFSASHRSTYLCRCLAKHFIF